ncbi:hypothetical protein PIB30_081067 [Stylosanthes scabra]|uniref:Secreted protein n=1 Tax=Stylosanthes scabra TaxID=79078 RepID=A0ABU6QR78_9FABA|nr:hypothetical protein [Stylosanthes scabra]
MMKLLSAPPCMALVGFLFSCFLTSAALAGFLFFVIPHLSGLGGISIFSCFRHAGCALAVKIQRCALLLDLEPSTPDSVLYKLVHGPRLAFVLLIHKLISCPPWRWLE